MAYVRTGTSFANGLLVLGFPGLGNVGPIAAKYLVEKLEMKWSGYIHSTALPPVGRVSRGRLLHPINIFSSGNLHVIYSEVSIPQSVAWDLSSAIMSKARKDGARLVVVLAGVLLDGDGVYAIPSDKAARSVVERENIEEIENGIITGVSAGILLSAREGGPPALLLLAPVKRDDILGPLGSLLARLSSILKREIPLADLEEVAHRMHHESGLIRRRVAEEAPIYG